MNTIKKYMFVLALGGIINSLYAWDQPEDINFIEQQYRSYVQEMASHKVSHTNRHQKSKVENPIEKRGISAGIQAEENEPKIAAGVTRNAQDAQDLLKDQKDNIGQQSMELVSPVTYGAKMNAFFKHHKAEISIGIVFLVGLLAILKIKSS